MDAISLGDVIKRYNEYVHMANLTKISRKSKSSGRKAEKKFAELLGGKRVAFSGSAKQVMEGKFSGDIKVANLYLVESKAQTVNGKAQNFKLSRLWLEQIKEEAKSYETQGEKLIPLLGIHYKGTPAWYIILNVHDFILLRPMLDGYRAVD
jgi:hypothetical protein